MCDGFLIEIFEDDRCPVPLKIISAAAGYELSENSEDEAAAFAQEYIDEMIEIYREMQREK